MKLGFIGLGIMGTPMAINLARAGHQLHVTCLLYTSPSPRDA